MKLSPFLACLSLLFFALSAQAKIWRVNNSVGVTADFTTAQAAHNGASAGDTIHLEPSPNNYGGVTCTKQLVWLSIGTYLTQNPGLQASTTPGTLSNMSMNAGSDGSILSVVSNSYIYIYVSNITITRSYFESYIIASGSISNLVINRTRCLYINTENISNAVVTNNLVLANIYNGTNGTAIVKNNVMNIAYRPENYTGVTYFYNSVVQDNIIVKGGAYNFSNSQASYNMTPDASGIPAGNNNIFSAVMTNVFVNPVGSSDVEFQLKAGSPAIAAGSAGNDMGAFGGSTPFVLGLQPPIPAVTALSSPASNTANTIQVTFSAKSNQ